MFGVPGPLGAKLGNFEFGGWGAHVCYSLPRLGARAAPELHSHNPRKKFSKLRGPDPGPG